MPYRTPWTNFTAGEFTPLLNGRMDLKKYFNSARLIWNFTVKPYGGISKDPGTRMLYECKDETRVPRLVPFRVRSDQNYMLCFEGGRMNGVDEVGGYLRFFADGGIISSGGVPYEIETDYTEADLRDIRVRQYRDVMFIYHPNHYPKRLVRNGHTDWSIASVLFTFGPHKEPNQFEDSFIVFSGRTGAIDIYAREEIFESSHVGRKMRILDGEVEITSVANAHSATAIVRKEISDGQFEKAYGRDFFSEVSKSCTLPNGSEVFTCKAHGFSNGQKVTFKADTVPTNFTNGASYYVVNADTNTFNLSSTLGGAAITSGSASAGIELFPHWEIVSGTPSSIASPTVTGTAAFSVRKKFDLKYEEKYLFIADISGDVSSTNKLNVSIQTQDYNTATGDVMTGSEYTEIVADMDYVEVGDGIISFTLDLGEYVHGQMDFDSATNSYPADPDSVEATVTLTYSGAAGKTLSLGRLNFRRVKPDHPIAAYDWAWRAFDDPGSGYPRAGHIFEKRHILLGNAEYPNAMWFSNTDDFYKFDASDPEVDSSAMFMQLVGGSEVEAVSWGASRKDLWIASDYTVWRVSPTEAGGSIAPTKVKAFPEAAFGSAGMEAVYVDSVVLYAERSRRNVRGMSYDLENDAYRSDQLTIFAEHLFRDSQIAQMCWQQQPFGVLWALRTDGIVCGMTYLKNEQVIAWHRHDFGGAITESIATMQDSDGHDQLWLCTQREINGVTRRFVEMQEREYLDVNDWRYLACALNYDGTPIGTVSGLTHLVGETVNVFADGVWVNDQVVAADGTIPLEDPSGAITASKITVGLPYDSILQTQNIEQQLPYGTVQGMNLRISNVFARLYATGPKMWCVTSESYEDITKWEPLDFRKPSDPMDGPLPPYTGDYRIYVQSTYSPESSLYLIHRGPTACNVLGLVYEWEEGS